MKTIEYISIVAVLVCAMWAQETDFKGKVVVAGSGPQIETSIDIIADALTKSHVPVKVMSEPVFRRAASEKLATNGGVSLIYLNQDLTPRQRPKLVVECYDPQGNPLWKEETSLTFAITAEGSAKKMAERIAKKVQERAGGPCLPKQ